MNINVMVGAALASSLLVSACTDEPAPSVERGDAGPPDAGVDSGNAQDTDASVTQVHGEILTQRYDNARTGAGLDEHVLTPARLGELQLLGSYRVDGEIYAQVLVASDVKGAGSARALAIVATMNNSIYAFDADGDPNGAPLWHQGAMEELGVPGFSERNVHGLNGILSTPVIDKAAQHLYAVARNCPFDAMPPSCHFLLHRLDLRSGAILDSTPVTGAVTVNAGNPPAQTLEFDPNAHWNRPGVALVDNELYLSFGSGPEGSQHEEDFVYHGWVFRYDVTDLLRAPDVYCTTPYGRGGSVWQSGAAPAADDAAVYLTGANGIFADGKVHVPADWPSTPVSQEDSVIALSRRAPLPSADMRPTQYWDDRTYLASGNVFQHMESGDNGFGSSGPTLIPDSNHLLVGSKAGLVYLLERDTLRPAQDPLNPFTDLALQPEHTLYLHSWWGIPMIAQSFVFWRSNTTAEGDRFGYAYAWAYNDRLRALRYDYAEGSLELVATADVPAIQRGGNLVLSANGAQPESGVLWATSLTTEKGSIAGHVWAFDPLSLGVLWQADTPAWSKFNPPTVVRGRVFVPSTAPDAETQQVLVYGIP